MVDSGIAGLSPPSSWGRSVRAHVDPCVQLCLHVHTCICMFVCAEETESLVDSKGWAVHLCWLRQIGVSLGWWAMGASLSKQPGAMAFGGGSGEQGCGSCYGCRPLGNGCPHPPATVPAA